jgi:hypothetical protein
VVFILSGRLELRYIEQLRVQFAEERRPIILDFANVSLVDREVIETLAQWEREGVTLETCPAYVRDWVAKVQTRN